MPSRMRAARLLVVVLGCAGPLVAQCPPGAPMPADLTTLLAAPAPGSPADLRWQLARQALAAGKLDEARRHLLAALEYHPASPALLQDVVLACTDDTDLLALWTERWVRSSTDARGKQNLSPAQRKQIAGRKEVVEPAAEASRLFVQRSAAMAELERFVGKQKSGATPAGERAVIVRWAAELALQIGDGAPHLLGQHGPAIGAVARGFVADHTAILNSLRALLGAGTAMDAAAADRALRAARVLVGLQRQADLPDRLGTLPADRRPLDEAAAAAREWILRVERERLDAARVWTVAELEAHDVAAAEAFTAAHRSWLHPAVATSPGGRYRIETTCGHGTLLGVARTIELHHARLVAHYGSDPFEDRPGLVRIVPDHTDMETDGTPHWWAGGFQAGDRTTVRFAWGNLPGLGRTLTHELTHRFDGVLRPFLGAWYGEGHASWTAAHYGRASDVQFVEDFLDRGAVATAHDKGYGDRARFEALLQGKVEDYRDNYPVGYALYAFLRGHPPGGPWPYREALATYERNARAGMRDPLGYFTQVFCDGQAGRAASFDAFLAAWQSFLRGCAEWTRGRPADHEWVGRYGDLGPGDDAPLVLDEPTWSWARQRSEPFFGQGHAATAAHLLHEAGDRAGALAAGLWSLEVDGWQPATAAAILASLRAGRNGLATAAFAALVRQRFPQLEAAVDVPARTLPAVAALLAAVAARSAALDRAGATVAAAALAAEHSRLAALFATPAAAAVRGAPPSVPAHLGGHGFTETALLHFDERRHAGLWFTTPDGDVHVGREKPREGTGTVDRAAQSRNAFVHSVAWHGPGDYVLRGRVHFTTSYVDGALVFGHQRRDRNLRLEFTSGDFDYAAGRRGDDRDGGHVEFRLRGLMERDGALPGTAPNATHRLAVGRSWFDYALYVRGPHTLVEIDGEAVCRYATHDGTPIEGHVGFAVHAGAIRVQQPTLQLLAPGDPAARGLDVARQPTAGLEDLLLRPTHGLPLGPAGTLVVWLPRAEDGAVAQRLPRALPVIAKLLAERIEHPQTVVLALPADAPAGEREAALREVSQVLGAAPAVVEHRVGAPLQGHYPFVLFVDHLGLLRAAAEIGDVAVHSRVQKWARLFRSRSGG